MLTKGIAGLVIPLLITGFYFIKEKGQGFRKMSIPLGVVIFISITLPWFIAIIRAHPGAYLTHIWQVETLNRIGNFNVFKNLLRYLMAAGIIFLPTVLFLPGAAINAGKNRPLAKKVSLMLIWMGTVLMFFTLFGTKKMHYLLLLAPPLAIFVGGFISKLPKESKCLKTAQVLILGTAFIYVAVFGVVMPALQKEDGLRNLSKTILSVRKEGEKIGIGSHFVSHNRVSSYLGIKVKKVNVDAIMRAEEIARSSALLNLFLDTDERVFCLIRSEDYVDYLSPRLKRNLYILDEGWYWKKPNQFNIDRDFLIALPDMDKDTFNHTFKNKIYLISNRREGD